MSSAASVVPGMPKPRIIQQQMDAGVSLPGEPSLQMAVEIHMPAPLLLRPMALVCMPGGGMNRHYFDLMAKDGATDALSFSFARAMTAQGFIVVMLDYLGIGGSSRPADGYALTTELLVKANGHVIKKVLAELSSQVPGLKSIGVGHSMGAMMTVLHQAQYATHEAIALLGFSTRGMPEYLHPKAQALAAQGREAVHAQLVELARKMFPEPYPVMKSSAQSSTLFAGSKADPRAAAIVKPAVEPLLPVPAFHSMLPGNVAPEAAAIKVPVFLGLGELDIAGSPQDIPPAFPASPDVSLHIWPATGHSHFLFPSRTDVFGQIADWAGKFTK